MPDLKLYYIAIVIQKNKKTKNKQTKKKTAWYWYSDRQINRIELKTQK
jgi:hypothetical protein